MTHSTAVTDKDTQVNLDEERIQELEQRLAKLELVAAKPQTCSSATSLASSAHKTSLAAITSAMGAAKQIYSKASGYTKATANAVVTCGKYLKPMVFSREAVELLALGVTTMGVVVIAKQQQAINRINEKFDVLHVNQVDVLNVTIQTSCFHRHANIEACSEVIDLFMKTNNKQNADVQYSAGEMYFQIKAQTGHLPEKATGSMLRSYQKAAAQKHKDALYRLGDIYSGQNFGINSLVKALEYYQEAHENGHPGAQAAINGIKQRMNFS